VAEDFDHEEGVPLGLLPHRRGEVVVEGRVTGESPDVSTHRRPVETGQGVTLDASVPAEVGQKVREEMPPIDVSVPVGDDEQDSRLIQGPHHMAQQQHSRLGRPLEVVKHNQNGLPFGGSHQPGGHGIEEAIPLGLRVGPKGGREARNPLAELWE